MDLLKCESLSLFILYNGSQDPVHSNRFSWDGDVAVEQVYNVESIDSCFILASWWLSPIISIFMFSGFISVGLLSLSNAAARRFLWFKGRLFYINKKNFQKFKINESFQNYLLDYLLIWRWGAQWYNICFSVC